MARMPTDLHLAMSISPSTSIANFLSAAPSYVLGGLSGAQTVAARNAKCQSCEHLERASQRCKLCGCYVWAKMRAAAATCPDNRWPPAT